MIGAAAKTRTAPLKRIAQIMVSNVDKKAVEGEVSVRLCNYVDVYKHDAITDELPFMEATASMDQIARFTLHSGDVLITKDSETPDDIAVSAYVPENLPGVVCGYHLAILRPRGQDVDGRYLHWAISSSVVCGQFHASALGITRFGLRQSAIGEIEVPVPPVAQQRSIADYLDRETAQIDSLIQRKQRLMDLVRERSDALIRSATRYGLAGAALRTAKAAWIGDVPEHWHVLPLRRIGRLVAGAAFPEEFQGQRDGDLPYFKVADFESAGNEVYLLAAANTVTPAMAARLGSPVIPASAVAFPKIGAALLTNRRRLVGREACTDQNVMSLVINHGFPKYFYYLLQTIDFGRLRMPGPVPLFNEADAAALLVPIPPVEEQRAIADQLDRKVPRDDLVIRRETELMDLLTERRQALITAVISGQCDIPEAA